MRIFVSKMTKTVCVYFKMTKANGSVIREHVYTVGGCKYSKLHPELLKNSNPLTIVVLLLNIS